ncbi:MAG: hypothetical protein QOF04_2167, partial [Solirubrobacteraceae bacterium]|nr:hypothetical protein [Solirubrobacteraceae bacterium]
VHRPADAAKIALGRLSSGALGAAREVQLRARPIAVDDATIDGALAGATAAATLRERALRALPVLAAFDAELERPGGDRTALVACADALVAHRFDLLGSGPTDLGDPIDWARDFKTGVRWPTRHVRRLRENHPDESDILVPSVLCWFQHLPVLAAAHRVTGDERYVADLRAQVTHWIATNPVELGIHWLSPMDAAVRATNWVAAATLVASPRDDAWLRSVMAALIAHGRFIEAGIDDEPRNNHYVTCLVALLVLSIVLEGTPEAADWRAFALPGLADEMEVQVHPDGSIREGSIAYLAFVAELFLLGADAAVAVGAPPPATYAERTQRMLDFAAHYTQPSGRAPQFGDTGSWRMLPLDDYARRPEPASHLEVLRRLSAPVQRSARSAAYPDGGFYVLQRGGAHLMVRCGGTGVSGHMHHDQLSFELAFGAQAMVVDPGTFLYGGGSWEERNRFRSTSFHSALRIGDLTEAEFHPVDRARMDLASRSEVTRWEPDAPDATLAAVYHGFELLEPPAVHRRTFVLDAGGTSLLLRDEVESDGAHDLEWTFPLAAGTATLSGGAASVAFAGGVLVIEPRGVDLAVEHGWYSPDYGVRERVPFLRARRRSVPGADVTEFRLSFGG